MEYIEDYATSLYNEQKSIQTITSKPMYIFTETNQQTGKQKSVTFNSHDMAFICLTEYCDIFDMEYIENDGEYTAGGSGDVYRIELKKIIQ